MNADRLPPASLLALSRPSPTTGSSRPLRPWPQPLAPPPPPCRTQTCSRPPPLCSGSSRPAKISGIHQPQFSEPTFVKSRLISLSPSLKRIARRSPLA